MTVNGLWFGLFIIAVGVVIVYRTLGKKDDEIVSFGRAFAEAKYGKIWGQMVIIGGQLLSLASLLI